MTRPILIIGYGNLLRGDDALGVLAAERLLGIVENPEVEILPVHQLTPELAEPISRAGSVIFIDAYAGPDSEEIMERAVSAEPAAGASFTHRATPEGLLALALALYGRAAEACMYSVAGSDFAYSSEPSARLSRRVESVVAAVLRRIA